MTEQVLETVVGAQVQDVVQVMEVKHSLLDFFPQDQPWEEGVAEWGNLKYTRQRIGWLHGLLGDCWEGCGKLVMFLLGIADGYVSSYNFHHPNEYTQSDERERIRQKIAEKAFSVLCLNFFGKTEGIPLWRWMFKDTELFEKVLWFLRMDGDNLYNFRERDYPDVNRNHLKDVFREFLINFAKIGWEFRSFCNRFDVRPTIEMEKRVVAVRPQLIEVLAGLGMLDWLVRKELDRGSLNKLNEMALGREVYLPSATELRRAVRRKPRDLGEAIFKGSVAAEVLLLNKTYQSARRKFEALEEKLARKIRETDKQRALAELRANQKELARRERELSSKG